MALPDAVDPPPVEITSPALTVFLVRHAEKVDSSADAALSDAGRTRASALAHVLADARVEHVHSSDYVRTRDTAAPLATALGLTVQLYDPGDLLALRQRLVTEGGRHLVVGHSNTTPELVSLLGGEPGTPIEEGDEYDRLYLVEVSAHGDVSSTLLRYGAKQ